MSDNDLPGIRLETIVARIQQKMDPNSTVSHNEKLVDRLGNKRQYDVVIRGHYAGRPILGVIECKDHSRRKGPDAVEAFAKKTENLRANLKLMVSKKGFTPQALVVAEHEGIGCLSLLPEDPKQAGFSIGQMWYGVHRQWTDVRMEIQFPVIPAPIESFDLLKVKWDGKTVFNWFWRELLTTYKEYNEEGYVMIKNTFDQVRNIEIEGQEYPVEAITCIAHQVLKKKRRWISLTGDAFFDWNANHIKIPPNGRLVGSAFSTDPSTWDDYDGEIPDIEKDIQPGEMRAFVQMFQDWDSALDADVPDLSIL